MTQVLLKAEDRHATSEADAIELRSLLKHVYLCVVGKPLTDTAGPSPWHRAAGEIIRAHEEKCKL